MPSSSLTVLVNLKKPLARQLGALFDALDFISREEYARKSDDGVGYDAPDLAAYHNHQCRDTPGSRDSSNLQR